jgi:glycerophosphoryl diester phosphodiesterase
MIIIAHRGGNRVFPENSVAAINHSFQAGADIVEIDVRLSQDNIPVVIHDEHLRRLFFMDRKVCEVSAGELTDLQYGDRHLSHLATLESVLNHCQSSPLLLHIREENRGILTILEVVEKCQWVSKVVFGIVSPDNVHCVKERNPHISFLAFMPSPDDFSRFLSAGVGVIRLWDSWITKERIDLIHRSGALVAAMTGSPEKDVGETSVERLLELKNLGIDWVLVNDVQLAANTLRHL